MQRPADTTSDTSASAGGGFARPWLTPGAASGSRLFRKYAALLFALVASSLIANAAIQMFYTWRESRAAISAIQREKAQGAAAVIEQFIREIEGQVGWTTHANVLAGASGIDQRRFDFLRLLRQAPAVTEVTYVDPQGREQLKVSRLAMDVVGSGADYSADPRFVEAKAKRRHVSSVYFRKESEPYLTLSIAGQGRTVGVTIAEINLKFIWDVVSRIEVGRAGVAYVVDQGGHLIAHPDIGLVLRKTDMSGLAHVAAARARLASAADPIASAGAASSAPVPETALDRNGQEVLTASAPIRSLAWLVMVDQPLSEALAPVRGTFNRSLLVLLGGLGLAVAGGMWLARRMAVPINALAAGAERMGAGDLDHRIDVRTGDEVERLGLAFNAMGSRLKDSYAHLERKVEERTAELQQSLEYQTAISDVLGVIARSPSDLQPVLDQIVRTARRLCDAERATIHQPSAGGHYVLVATDGPAPFDETTRPLSDPVPVDRGSMIGRAVLARRPVMILDAQAEPDFTYLRDLPNNRRRSMLGVPLITEGTVIGTITLTRTEVRPFTPRQIALVSTFADQAVIAIENARLFEAEQTRTREVEAKSAELTQSLEYQTAISDVLGVISRSKFDLQPVLDTIVQTAARLCHADWGVLRRRHGETYAAVATVGLSDERREIEERFPIGPSRQTTIGRVLLERRTIHLPDVMRDADYIGLHPQFEIDFRSSLAVPLQRHGELAGVLALFRANQRPFSPQEIALVETFADQAVIAIENTRLFEAEQTRTRELAQALDRQTGSAKVLGVISASPGQLQPVLETILDEATRLCGAQFGVLDQFDGKAYWPKAARGEPALDAWQRRGEPALPSETNALGLILRTKKPVHFADLREAPGYQAGDPAAKVMVDTLGGRGYLLVPMLKDGEVVGAINIFRKEPGLFDAQQVELVESFADQAVIAIENARLFEAEQTRTRELTESLEYQTATSEVLAVISRAPNELQPVLDTIARTSQRLCLADRCTVWRLKGGEFEVGAVSDQSPTATEYLKRNPVPADSSSIAGRCVVEKQTIHVRDRLNEPGFPALEQTRAVGARTMMSVPMLREGEPIGAVTLIRSQVEPFTGRQIALVETFADQAVIAIENARLFEAEQTRTKELQESLEYRTAMADVLSIIARSPSNVQEVLDAVVANAARVCIADNAIVFRVEGEVLKRVARTGTLPSIPPDGPSPHRIVSRGSVSGRSVVDRRTIHVHDLAAQEAEYPDAAAIGRFVGNRSIVATPLIRDGMPLGTIMAIRKDVRPFTDKQIALLETFAAQAVIAIENARLFEAEQTRTKELQGALTQQTATADVLKAISRSAFDLQPVLDTLVKSAARLCSADYALIRQRRGEEFAIVATEGLNESQIAHFRSYSTKPGPGSVFGRAVLNGRTEHVPDMEADPQFERLDAPRAIGHSATLVVPLMREGNVVGVFSLMRIKPGPFSRSEIALVETFADQAVIAINNVGLFEEVQARTKELQESLEYQTATSEVLSVISRSPDTLQPVLDAIVATAKRLCEAEYALIRQRKDDGRFHLTASVSVDPAFVEWMRTHPVSLGDGSMFDIVATERQTVHFPDALAEPRFKDYARQQQSKARTMLGVPLMRAGEVIGVIFLARTVVEPFTQRQIDLVTTFANQAVIAINNVGLFEEVQTRTKELTESLEQQTATAKILRTISGSPGKLDPVFDEILYNASRLCDAGYGHLLLFDGQAWQAAALQNVPEAYADWWRDRRVVAAPETLLYRVQETAQPLQIVDLVNGSDYEGYRTKVPLAVAAVELGGARTLFGVPLMKEGRVVGAFFLYRKEVRPFDEKQMKLLAGFADQAVIAIENARLFEAEQTRTKELTESLEYQTAMSQVLDAISRSPNDAQPVFDVIAHTAWRLCEAGGAHIFVRGEDGCYGLVSVEDPNVESQYRERFAAAPLVVDRGSVTGRAALECRSVQVHDVQADPEFTLFRDDPVDHRRTMLSVPLVRGGVAAGIITLVRTEVKPFTAKQIALVETFANQALIAIENARLFQAVQTRTQELARSVEELQSLGAVSRTVSATLDMSQVLTTVLENACRMAYAGGGTVYVYDKDAGEFRLEAGHNMSETHIQRVREQPIRMGEAVVGECGSRREVVQIADLSAPDAPRTPLVDILVRDGVRAVLAVPLLHQGEVIGALVIRRTFPGAFSPEIVRLLEAFAAQSAIAVNNARLFKDIEEKGRQLELASQHKSQFLANMSHELRTPLNAILGYTELLADGTYGALAERPKGVLDRIDRNGKHLLGLINDVLDLSKIEAGEMQLALEDYALGSIVQNTITVTEPLARQKGLELKAAIEPNLPLGRGDARRLSQVLLNLVGNAIKFTDKGRIDVAATRDGERFRLTVRDTGPGIPEAEQAKIFEKFQQVDNTSTRRKGGSGLGLSISKELVEMHGGTISVVSAPGEGSTFEVVLPNRVCPTAPKEAP